MDTDTLVELIPHYAAMLVIFFLVVTALGAVVGELGFWIEIAIAFVVVFAYRPIVTRLGVAPSAWEGR
jgi:hypothetical protein